MEHVNDSRVGYHREVRRSSRPGGEGRDTNWNPQGVCAAGGRWEKDGHPTDDASLKRKNSDFVDPDWVEHRLRKFEFNLRTVTRTHSIVLTTRVGGRRISSD